MLEQTAIRVSCYPPGSAMEPHAHAEASLNIVLDGDFLERIGSGERIYGSGHAAFCPADMVHSQHFGAAGARQIIFAPQKPWLTYLGDCNLKLEDAPYAGSDLFRRLGSRLLQELTRDDNFAVLAREGILLEIVAAFGRHRRCGEERTQPPAWLRRAHDFLHENVSEQLSMKRIAQEAGRHEIHVAREFRRFYGASIGTYTRKLRVERATRLLLAPRTNISEIAQACGFASHAHLCKAFKLRFGITPSEYRAQSIRQTPPDPLPLP